MWSHAESGRAKLFVGSERSWFERWMHIEADETIDASRTPQLVIRCAYVR